MLTTHKELTLKSNDENLILNHIICQHILQCTGYIVKPEQNVLNRLLTQNKRGCRVSHATAARPSRHEGTATGLAEARASARSSSARAPSSGVTAVRKRSARSDPAQSGNLS